MPRKVIDQTGAEVATTGPATLVPANRADVERAARELVTMIPEMPEGDGAGILAAILNATTVDELSRQSKLPAGKDLVGVEMKIYDVHRMPSDLEGEDDGTGIRLDDYVIVDALTGRDGTELRWQTSAPGLVLPIAKLYVWGKLPAVIRIQQADKPTKRGFRPLNVAVHATS